MIKPLAISFYLSVFLFVRVPHSPSLPLSRARQKSALRGEIAHAEAPSSVSFGAREPPPRASSLRRGLPPPPPSSLLLLLFFHYYYHHYYSATTSSSSFFFFSATSSSSSSSYGGDGGFQRDVLVAANSMRDESDSGRTVTDTGRRSIAG